MSCKEKIENRCGKKINALCVIYEGTLSSHSALDPEDCHNMQEVVEDINGQLDTISSEIDLTGLESTCIDYAPAGPIVTPKEAILAINAKICEMIAQESVEDPTICIASSDPCSPDLATLGGLIYYNFATGAFPLTSVGTWVTGVTTTDQYSTNMQHTITKPGKYKFTIEVSGVMDSASTARIGIGINSNTPIETSTLVGLFSSVLITEEANVNSTITFLQTLSVGDSIAVVSKLVSGTQFLINNLKIVTEKIG